MSHTLRTLDDRTTTLPDEALDELDFTLHGELLSPGDPDYDEVRVVQNAMHDRRPALIARCSGPADVMDALDFAREHDLLTAVRGGGHSVAGHCTCDDGLMIDLSAMRGTRVDPERRTVRVAAGATWADVDRESQAFGLAVPGGIISTTGVAGLTLGGGIGWLHRKYGLACDALRSADVVTPDGERVLASESRHPELFWGLRGGGGNFGVVTSFEFEAYPLGSSVMCGAAMYPIEEADSVFPRWRDWASTVPEEVTTRAMFWWLPETDVLPPAVHDREVLVLGAVYAGPVEEGEPVLGPVSEFGEPLADLSGPHPYRMFQSAFDPLFPKGELSSYWKSVYLDEITPEVTEFVLEVGRKRPTPRTLVHLPLMGGAPSRVEPDATAFGDRGASYMLSVDGNWTDREDRERVVEWVRDTVERAKELDGVRGTYLNFTSDPAEQSEAVVTDAFGANLDRLVELKTRYDPENRLRLNSNIVPA